MTFIAGDNTYQKRKRDRVYLKVTPQVIADARGVTRGAVHKAISRGALAPRDIFSIARYILGRRIRHGAFKNMGNAVNLDIYDGSSKEVIQEV